MDSQAMARFHAALDLYNRGAYLDCQEALEELHREVEGEEQSLVRGVLTLACAMHLHFHRGGGRGALNLIRQSLLLMDDLRPERLGVDVDELYEALEAYLGDLQERRKPGAGFFDRWLAPRIRYRAGS